MTQLITRQRMVMAPLEAVKRGRQFRRLPPHLTILPWFDLAVSDHGYFRERMDDIATEERLTSVTGVERAMLGPSNDTPATLLGGVILGVHFHAMKILAEVDAAVDPQYTGMNYTPHVSDHENFAVGVGQPLSFSSLAVVGKGRGGNKVVEEVYEWAS